MIKKYNVSTNFLDVSMTQCFDDVVLFSDHEKAIAELKEENAWKKQQIAFQINRVAEKNKKIEELEQQNRQLKLDKLDYCSGCELKE